eukprot:Phypoly_transcript_16917.p1 GENE.Phypoly_transcript_16917~~Phypoly_transcript_16917.p1  ORF type:complete len:238 (+),score=19.82 Phypoly_transcript_16917:66-716(+)
MSLFIGRIPSDCRPQDLEEHFEKFGRITRCDVKPSGYGFIEFEDKRDAEDAIRDLDGSSLLGARIVVEWARGGRNASRREGGGGDSACFTCGKEGHWARDCPDGGRGGGGFRGRPRGGGGYGGGGDRYGGGGRGYGGGGRRRSVSRSPSPRYSRRSADRSSEQRLAAQPIASKEHKDHLGPPSTTPKSASSFSWFRNHFFTLIITLGVLPRDGSCA